MRLPLIFTIILLCFSSNSHSHSETKIVEQSIGSLILSHDRKFSYSIDDNSFGGELLFQEFKAVYLNKIKNLSEKHRLEFLWASMWHLGFDGHTMFEFQELILNDCGQAFINKLESFINKEEKLQRDKSRLYLSKKVLTGLVNIKNSNKKS